MLWEYEASLFNNLRRDSAWVSFWVRYNFIKLVPLSDFPQAGPFNTFFFDSLLKGGRCRLVAVPPVMHSLPATYPSEDGAIVSKPDVIGFSEVSGS